MRSERDKAWDRRTIEEAQTQRERALANIAAVNRRIGDRLTAQPTEPVMVDYEIIESLAHARAMVRASWDVAAIIERAEGDEEIAAAALRRLALRGLSQAGVARSTSAGARLLDTYDTEARVEFARALGVFDYH